MQLHRIAGQPPAQSLAQGSWTGSVLGLGVTDLLRVEVKPVQVPALVEQIGETSRVYEREVARDESRWDVIPEGEREVQSARVVDVARDLDASRFDVRALNVIRVQLEADGDDSSIETIVGPSRIVSELVRDTARRAAMSLNELLDQRPRGDADARERLLRAARAASAWVETYVECEAIEWFRFEIDPMPTGS